MNCRVFTLLIGLVLAACALPPPPDSAALPRYANGARVITETFLLELASYTLISPVRCKDSPVDAIRSVAGVEYFASALQWNAAWPNISNMTKLLMVQGQAEVRQVLGIRPETRTQEVVDRLFVAADALNRNDTMAARLALTSPDFTLGPDGTFNRLLNLPYLPKANWAVQAADREAFPPGSGCAFGSCS